jgi:hypothetical protein
MSLPCLSKIQDIRVKNINSATFLSNNHFRVIFYLNEEVFLMDDFNPTKMLEKFTKLNSMD